MTFESMILYGACCSGLCFLVCIGYIILENLRTTYNISSDKGGWP